MLLRDIQGGRLPNKYQGNETLGNLPPLAKIKKKNHLYVVAGQE